MARRAASRAAGALRSEGSIQGRGGRAGGSGGGPEDARHVFDELLRRGIPDVFSYNILLNGLCDENRSQEALELLHIMADDGGDCPPDVVSYSTVIYRLVQVGVRTKLTVHTHEMLEQRDFYQNV
uniref:Fertility restorer n=1 Tax=Oryza sativa subsp. indica TaxID=39946 RepID=A7J144_ORYSI|nr:fertility restorer [Oryza sativa Indica Group]